MINELRITSEILRKSYKVLCGTVILYVICGIRITSEVFRCLFFSNQVVCFESLVITARSHHDGALTPHR